MRLIFSNCFVRSTETQQYILIFAIEIIHTGQHFSGYSQIYLHIILIVCYPF